MPTDPNPAVNELADRFWEGVLERDPVTATILGDDRYDDRLPDLGEAGRAADTAAFRETLADAEARLATAAASNVGSSCAVCASVHKRSRRATPGR